MEDNFSKIVSEFIGNSEELKKDVAEAARAGIKKEITEYFTGYSSPFRKQVHEYLQKNIPMARFSLPSYAEIVNKEIIAEIDKMAAQTCISTFCKCYFLFFSSHTTLKCIFYMSNQVSICSS